MSLRMVVPRALQITRRAFVPKIISLCLLSISLWCGCLCVRLVCVCASYVWLSPHPPDLPHQGCQQVLSSRPRGGMGDLLDRRFMAANIAHPMHILCRNMLDYSSILADREGIGRFSSSWPGATRRHSISPQTSRWIWSELKWCVLQAFPLIEQRQRLLQD